MKNQRNLLLVVAIVFALTTLGRADNGTRQTAAPVVVKKDAPKAVLTFPPFKGWGITDELAQQKALENARSFLERHGEQMKPPREWRLTAEEVQQKFVKSRQAHPDQDKTVNGEQVKCWSVTVEITAAQLEALDQEARALEQRTRARDRMTLWFKLVLLGVLVTGAIGGYLRLEEWAHWRSTFVPRLAGVALLTAVGAGAWLLW